MGCFCLNIVARLRNTTYAFVLAHGRQSFTVANVSRPDALVFTAARHTLG